MHSSRIRTARSLPYSGSVSRGGGEVSVQGGSLSGRPPWTETSLERTWDQTLRTPQKEHGTRAMSAEFIQVAQMSASAL